MEYDSKKSKTIDNDERKCPYCNSLNIKEYLYGEPVHNYDREKYVLGGCVISLDNPRYKCSDCGKDIYVKRNMDIPNIITINTNNDILNECILINYSTTNIEYEFKLSKRRVKHAGIDDYTSSICLKKIDYNSIYKIDGVQHLESEDFDKYYNKLMQITSNWIDEFDNNKLVSDDNIREWSLIINTKDNQLSFSDMKVPSNIKELNDVIIELEDLYKINFEKRNKQIHDIFN